MADAHETYDKIKAKLDAMVEVMQGRPLDPVSAAAMVLKLSEAMRELAQYTPNCNHVGCYFGNTGRSLSYFSLIMAAMGAAMESRQKAEGDFGRQH